MSASFFALLDDIAVLARAAAASLDDVAVGAAKASAKAAPVVIDDAAVTPQYVQGIKPNRELPVIWRITKGSLINKAVIIAAIMLLSVWAPWVFPWMLLVGGTYLAYEGAHKAWHWIDAARGHSHEPSLDEVVERSPSDEKQIVSSAVRTDFVLSVEIMLISLTNVESDSWGMRLAILIVIGIAMTLAVYGAVGLLVKMDDVGFWMRRRRPRWVKVIGSWIVKAMPWVFKGLTVVGTLAMLWVGGHILIVNLDEVGVPLFHHLLESITHAVAAPGVIIWLIDSALSAAFGFVWGSICVGAMTLFSKLRGGRQEPATHAG